MAPPSVHGDPPFLAIAAYLRQQILSGELSEGDRLPSTRQLTREWKVAIATASKALRLLRAEGYTRVIPGVGTVVRSSVGSGTAPDDLLSVSWPGGPQEHATIVSVGVVMAPQYVVDAIPVRKGAEVICRRWVTSWKGRPVSIVTSWLDAVLADRAPLLLAATRTGKWAASYVAECTGRAVMRRRVQLSAGDATAAEARHLSVAVGSPVLRGRMWCYDPAGAVLEFGESATVSGQWSTFDYESAAHSENTGQPYGRITPQGQ